MCSFVKVTTLYKSLTKSVAYMYSTEQYSQFVNKTSSQQACSELVKKSVKNIVIFSYCYKRTTHNVRNWAGLKDEQL